MEWLIRWFDKNKEVKLTLFFLSVDFGVPERNGELCQDAYGGIG